MQSAVQWNAGGEKPEPGVLGCSGLADRGSQSGLVARRESEKRVLQPVLFFSPGWSVRDSDK